MTQISAAHDRLQRAGDLAAVLDAAYAAFEGMVAVPRCTIRVAAGSPPR